MSLGPERDEPRTLSRSLRPVSRTTQIWTGIGLAAVAVVLVFWRGGADMAAAPPPLQQEAISATPITLISNPAPMVPAAPPPPPPPPGTQAAPPPPPSGSVFGSLPNPAGVDTGPKYAISFAVPADARQGAPGTTQAAAAAPVAAPAPAAPSTTTVAFNPQAMPGLRAGPAIDMTFVMKPGLYRFTLVAPLNTERCGNFIGKLSHPVKSDAGVTLMEKDSLIWGTCSTQVGQGQERVALATAWGITPHGVPVPLGDAGVGDTTGRAGVPGELQTHPWTRIRSAVTLMITQASVSAATAYAQAAAAGGRGGNNSFVNVQTGGLESALTETLRAGNGIQNTVDVAAGKEVTFMVAQPVSFDDAYRLAVR